jgi:hypothetical protein
LAFFFFFIFTISVWFSVPGCEPGLTNVAAFSSGNGENAMAIATAKAVKRLFLISISKYLPFPIPANAIPQITQSAGETGINPTCPCATAPGDSRFCKMNAQ